TVLPALLVLAGRWVFWPFVPRYGTPARKARTVWSRIGNAVARRPRWSWLMTVAATGVLALSAAGISLGLTQSEMFQDKPESVVAQERVSEHYPSGSSDPAQVVTRTAAAEEVRSAAAGADGVARVEPGGDRTSDGSLTTLSVVLEDAPDSDAAKDTVDVLRDAVHAVDGAD